MIPGLHDNSVYSVVFLDSNHIQLGALFTANLIDIAAGGDPGAPALPSLSGEMSGGRSWGWSESTGMRLVCAGPTDVLRRPSVVRRYP